VRALLYIMSLHTTPFSPNTKCIWHVIPPVQSHQLIIDALRLAHTVEHHDRGKKDDTSSHRSSSQQHLASSSAFRTTVSDQELVSCAVSKLNHHGYLVIPAVLTGPRLQSCRERAAVLLDIDSNDVIVAEPGSDQAINRNVRLRWVRPLDENNNRGSNNNTELSNGTIRTPAPSDGDRDDAHHHGHPAEEDGLQSAIALLRSVPSFLEASSTIRYERSRDHEVPNLCRLARMPGTGATYRPHRDATIYSLWEVGLVGWLKSRGYQRRVLTSILYLNEEQWSDHGGGDDDGGGDDSEETPPAAEGMSTSSEEPPRAAVGGSLRLHPNARATDRVGETTSGTHIDVRPSGGTLVIFDAKDILHEVTPTFRDRLTVTSWVVGDHRA